MLIFLRLPDPTPQLRHLPQTTPRLVAADSAALRTLAWSGTSSAESAGRWLRYFYPRIALPTSAPLVASPSAPSSPAQLKAKATLPGALLGAAYPNPAQAEVSLRYQLPAEVATAELSFTNLLTGRVQRTVAVTSGEVAGPQTVVVRELPAGQYVCRLLVAGQPVAVPQRVVVLP